MSREPFLVCLALITSLGGDANELRSVAVQGRVQTPSPPPARRSSRKPEVLGVLIKEALSADNFRGLPPELGGQNPDELIAAFRPIRCAPDPENHPAPSGSRGQSVGTHCSAAEASKPFLRAGTMQHHRSASGSSLKVLSQHGALGRWQVSPQFLAPSESAPQHSPPDQPEPLHLHSLDLSDGALAEAAKSRTEHHRAPSVARATAAASARFRTEAQPEPQACGLSRSPPHHSSGSLQLEGVWPGLGQLGPALEGRWGATGAA
eukprot:CAMPEP_0204406026 /NCGR_PEP_ID=MMETSP0470-20130426/7766_1 /ASSEMBLY_ACC=CAM_ASM_000385 /TAXON_ID=2969 /ORGANISM="Oxyrrhis marina" /LENGTH=262 /DNA_ID=CAMNT_0051401531 /DNA_START=316 /DNA_END=1101 /DNA_ORIENTATION=-